MVINADAPLQFFLLFLVRGSGSARHWRSQQHEEGRPGGPVLQPRAESRLADLHGAVEEAVDQERIFVQQGPRAASRDHTSRADRAGTTTSNKKTQSITINRAMAAARVVITSLIYNPVAAEPYKVV